MQREPRPDCPTISVTGPAGIPQPADEITFTLDIGEASKKYDLTYNWSTSIGEIVSGQGTKAIRIKWPGGSSTTATVAVKGLPAACPARVNGAGSWTVRLSLRT